MWAYHLALNPYEALNIIRSHESAYPWIDVALPKEYQNPGLRIAWYTNAENKYTIWPTIIPFFYLDIGSQGLPDWVEIKLFPFKSNTAT